jgi:hypothetical protein
VSAENLVVELSLSVARRYSFQIQVILLLVPCTTADQRSIKMNTICYHLVFTLNLIASLHMHFE